MSARSFSLSFGSSTVRKPIRWAARSFFFYATDGQDLIPRRVISPVMVTSQRTGILVSALTMEVQMVMPAEGAVLGDGAFRDMHVNVDVAIEVFWGRPKAWGSAKRM